MTSNISDNFDAAAESYDQSAKVQMVIAQRLIAWGAKRDFIPTSVLDIGSGTGFVADKAYQHWPSARIVALDSSVAMLKEAKRKMPQLSILIDDALTVEPNEQFDMIFSSMALHWLPDPHAALRRWQAWLKPNGLLFVALPVEGSFQEWHSLSAQYNANIGLWPLPPSDFASDLAVRSLHETISMTYSSANDFLRSIKMTGAATPRVGHRPIGTGQMRKILNASPRPFRVSYRVTFLELPASAL